MALPIFSFSIEFFLCWQFFITSSLAVLAKIIVKYISPFRPLILCLPNYLHIELNVYINERKMHNEIFSEYNFCNNFDVDVSKAHLWHILTVI